MDFVDMEARLEELLAPDPILATSRCVDPFDSPSGILGSVMTRLRDEGILMPAAFSAYRMHDLVSVMKPAARRLYGEARAAWEQLLSIDMSGMGEEAPIIDNMLQSFLELLVLSASLSPYLSDEVARDFIRKPYGFTVSALARRRERSNLTLR